MSRIMNILNQLYAGKTLTLKFENHDDRENFRQSLYKLKRTQDDALNAVDLQEERSQLRCKTDHKDIIENFIHTVEYFATFWLDKKKEISFEIISVEEINPEKETDDGSKEKVSGSMGEVSSGTWKDCEGPGEINLNDETR